MRALRHEQEPEVSLMLVEVEVTLQLTVSQSVSQYVEVSNPVWDLWPDITSCRRVAR
jgi:hypothetical protein